jgi:hypothetical protein
MRTLPIWNAELRTFPFWNANASKTSSVRPFARPHAWIAKKTGRAFWLANATKTSSAQPFARPHAWNAHSWNAGASSLECGIADVSILECERFENVVSAAVCASACPNCACLNCEHFEERRQCGRLHFRMPGMCSPGMRTLPVWNEELQRFHSGMRTLRKRRQCGRLRFRMPGLQKKPDARSGLRTPQKRRQRSFLHVRMCGLQMRASNMQIS